MIKKNPFMGLVLSAWVVTGCVPTIQKSVTSSTPPSSIANQNPSLPDGALLLSLDGFKTHFPNGTSLICGVSQDKTTNLISTNTGTVHNTFVLAGNYLLADRSEGSLHRQYVINLHTSFGVEKDLKNIASEGWIAIPNDDSNTGDLFNTALGNCERAFQAKTAEDKAPKSPKTVPGPTQYSKAAIKILSVANRMVVADGEQIFEVIAPPQASSKPALPSGQFAP